MDIIISGKNFDLTPSLKTYVSEKVGKLARYWPDIIRGRVELEVDRNRRDGTRHRVTITLEVPGPDIRVVEESSDIHAAIDEAVPKLERLVERAKGRGIAVHVRLARRAKAKLRDWYGSFRGV